MVHQTKFWHDGNRVYGSRKGDLPWVVATNGSRSVRIEWTNIGEGWRGDWNEDDPDDENLLRFYVREWSDEEREWADVEGGSMCTATPADTSAENLDALLGILMDRVEEPVISKLSIKKIAEEVSWIDPSWIGGKEVAK